MDNESCSADGIVAAMAELDLETLDQLRPRLPLAARWDRAVGVPVVKAEDGASRHKASGKAWR